MVTLWIFTRLKKNPYTLYEIVSGLDADIPWSDLQL